ncbi:hypothetical protein [Anaerobacillus sp. CMMVII]|nr:hypothetical protein [Anaerobacillus sp. CMMVII]
MGRNSTQGIVVKVTEDAIVLLCENGLLKTFQEPLMLHRHFG